MMTSFIITLSFCKAPSSGGAFPFQPLAASRLLMSARPCATFSRMPFSLPRVGSKNAAIT
ncbi:hypothetical protein DXV24_03535 [Escherichia albertii]|nr:hypothetical protein [Escherichia albertii]EFO0321345.1 hypothetical protein [Escherichia albertii]EFO1262321.1 hypothetical protein [Escherichia albertii]PPQ52402.1 hypothetical protein C4623_12890 [Escherichia albertii]